MTKDALAIQRQYIRSASSKLEQLASQYEEKTALSRQLRQFLQEKSIQIQKSGKQPDPKTMHELQMLYQHFQTLDFLSQNAKKLAFETSFGVEKEFAWLVGDCFEFVVNEKQLKGGSSNVVPREYVMVFCPFQNVTQTEPNYAKWKQQEVSCCC